MSEELYDDQVPAATKKSASRTKEDTVLDRLRETISKKVERPTVFIDVPARDGVKLRIAPNITQNQMKAWRRNSGEDTKNGMDATKFACYVVGSCTTGIFIAGEEVFDSDGNRMNFASQEILDMTGTGRPVPDAVRAFFGIDPHVESAALAVLDAAGYSDTVEAEDPTMGSSTN
jgi:hypothetical protein